MIGVQSTSNAENASKNCIEMKKTADFFRRFSTLKKLKFKNQHTLGPCFTVQFCSRLMNQPHFTAFSDLLMYAFIFIVKAVIGARGGLACEKSSHFILVKAHRAGIFLVIFVIIVKLAAFAV